MTYFKELFITVNQTYKAYVTTDGFQTNDALTCKIEDAYNNLMHPEIILKDFKLESSETKFDVNDGFELSELPTDIIIVDDILEPLGFKPEPLSFIKALERLENNQNNGYIATYTRVVESDEGTLISYFVEPFLNGVRDECGLTNESLKDEWYYFETLELLSIWLKGK